MDSELIGEIKKKKEFQSLSETFIEEFLKKYKVTEKNKKEIVKQVRAKLREVYGAFWFASETKSTKILASLKSLDDIETHIKILKMHRSTRERIPHYAEMYAWIFKDKQVKTLLDLGCGLNPFSYPFLPQKPYYIAVELAQKDADFISMYFKKFSIPGESNVIDLARERTFPKADLCFMFKIFDTLETIKPNITKELLDALDVSWLVVSFSTKTLGGKRAISKKRLVWFEKLINAYPYETLELENEFFYMIKKQ